MLEEKINNTLKQSLKENCRVGVSVTRMMINEIKNYKIAKIHKGQLSDEEVISILQKIAKKHRESIECFSKGKRTDLVKKEEEELVFLSKFLPEPLSDQQLDDIIIEVIKDVGASSIKDMPKVMKTVIPLVRGRADGKIVSSRVVYLLGKN